MNYKLQIHFLNDVTTWKAHVPALITMNIIKSPFLHQCRLHSDGNGFKIVQQDFNSIFIKSSRSKPHWLLISIVRRNRWEIGLTWNTFKMAPKIATTKNPIQNRPKKF